MRDDDYRLSFLHGNFVTLSNFTEADIHRILRFHLSPLYVSVHATEPKVRAQLMGSDCLPDVMPVMKRFVHGGIELHAQIVLCAGINDGKHLEKTVRDLSQLFPGVISIGIVPVGVIGEAKQRLRLVGANNAHEIITAIEAWQQASLDRFGTRLVWASDEMYLLARRDFPAAETYEVFAQRANGIGEARLFLDEVESKALERILEIGRVSGTEQERVQPGRSRRFKVILGSGVSASGMVAQFANKLNEFGISATVVVAVNRLFGTTITTAGLISGSDWLAALQQAPPGRPDHPAAPNNQRRPSLPGRHDREHISQTTRHPRPILPLSPPRRADNSQIPEKAKPENINPEP